MIGKLIYIMVTRPEIFFVIRLLNQVIYKTRDVHRKASLRVLAYVKGSSRKWLFNKKYEICLHFCFFGCYLCEGQWCKKSTTRYLTFIGGNLITWRTIK